MARKFFYVCAGLLMLAVAYQMGAREAHSQSGTVQVGVAFNSTYQVMYMVGGTGDVYFRHFTSNGQVFADAAPIYVGNFWDGVTAVQRQSWGAVKDTYRK